MNLAILKNEYVVPIVDMLVYAVANNGILSFVDSYSGYNQIYLADKDVYKTAFHCLRALGIFEWVVMPFGLKNAGATYQKVMNVILQDLIG